jgi:hypothetical protein
MGNNISDLTANLKITINLIEIVMRDLDMLEVRYEELREEILQLKLGK